MSNVQKEALSSAIGKNLGAIIGLASCGIFANWIWGIWSVEPSETYGWFRGAVSGGSFISNCVFSLFRDDVVIKDTLHTGAYSFWWWLMCIWASLTVILNALGFIVNVKALKSLS